MRTQVIIEDHVLPQMFSEAPFQQIKRDFSGDSLASPTSALSQASHLSGKTPWVLDPLKWRDSQLISIYWQSAGLNP